MSERKPRFLVTAGNTREKIDDVRDWGNIFTGETGVAIAKALSPLGEVELLTSNAAHVTACVGSGSIHARGFKSHEDLRRELDVSMCRNTFAGVFMTAAVADYKPVRTFQIVERQRIITEPGLENWLVRDVQRGKVRSTFDHIAVLGERTEKLVDLFRTEWRHRGLLVKFKLEVGISDDELLNVARKSRLDSGADYLVANTLEMVRGDTPGAFILGDGLVEWVARTDLPQHLADIASRHVGSRFSAPVCA